MARIYKATVYFIDDDDTYIIEDEQFKEWLDEALMESLWEFKPYVASVNKSTELEQDEDSILNKPYVTSEDYEKYFKQKEDDKDE